MRKFWRWWYRRWDLPRWVSFERVMGRRPGKYEMRE
ncbi:hypothetical protein SAMN05444404_3165 [Ruegeria lacuscaerulensis ITI-1157]|nr:hypothetical protein SAMN05444404_3165 [Ruegeria lacuscaerulensis ITI-1157]